MGIFSLAAAGIGLIGSLKSSKAKKKAARAAQAAQELAYKRGGEALYSGMYGSSGMPTVKDFEEVKHLYGGSGKDGLFGAVGLSEKLKKYEGTPIDEIPEEFRKYFNEHIGRKGSIGYLDDAQSQALGYLDRGRTAQLGALESGRDAALGAYSEGRDAASQYHQPYSQAGEQALGAYQTAMQEGYDPTKSKAFQLKEQLASKYLGQQLSAAGKARSGVGISQYSLPAYAQMVQQGEQDYFNRLNPLMQYGYGANTALANIQTGYGQNVANVQTGYGQNVSGVEGVDSRNRAKMAEALGVNKSGLAETYGRDTANLALGLGATQSGTALRVGNINAYQQAAPWKAAGRFIDEEQDNIKKALGGFSK